MDAIACIKVDGLNRDTYRAHRNKKKNRQQSQGGPLKAANGDMKPAHRRVDNTSSHAPSVAPSEAPASEAAGAAPPAETPAPSTGVVAAVTHAAEAAFTAVSAAAEKVVSLANGPVDEPPPPPQAKASEAVPEAADDGGSAGKAPDAANGLTPQQTEAGSADATVAAEPQHLDDAEANDGAIAAAMADEAPADEVDERKPPWSQPAALPADQAQKDKCAASRECSCRRSACACAASKQGLYIPSRQSFVAMSLCCCWWFWHKVELESTSAWLSKAQIGCVLGCAGWLVRRHSRQWRP